MSGFPFPCFSLPHSSGFNGYLRVISDTLWSEILAVFMGHAPPPLSSAGTENTPNAGTTISPQITFPMPGLCSWRIHPYVRSCAPPPTTTTVRYGLSQAFAARSTIPSSQIYSFWCGLPRGSDASPRLFRGHNGHNMVYTGPNHRE